MSRAIRAALALACVAPLIAACNLTATSAQISAALNPSTATGAEATTVATATGSAAFLAKVRAYAAAACKVEPSMSAVAKIAAALAPSSEAAIVTATAVADAFCQPGVKVTAAALTLKKSEPKAAEPKPGDPVKKLIEVNGKLIQVDGTKVK
jgi:hypothetical protein